MNCFKISCIAMMLMLSLNCSAQKRNNEQLVKSYAEEANRLDLQTNADSVDKAYKLHTKILKLDGKHVPSYRSLICIAYKRSNFKESLATANEFTTSLPGYADAWVYLGIVQMKLADSAKAEASFKKAISFYNIELTEVEDSSWQDNIKFKRAIVMNFLGSKTPVHTEGNIDENGNANSINTYINDIETVEAYVSRFMTYNGIQFF